MKVQEVQ